MSVDKPFYEPNERDENEDKTEKPCFELYIKASTIDGETKGSCPICHQWFMIAYLLAERKNASFRVYTVQASMPPKSFTEKTRSKIFPVVIGLYGKDNKDMDITDLVCDSYDEVEKFFESVNMTCPKLRRPERDNLIALKVFEDLYKDFKLFLQSRDLEDAEGKRIPNREEKKLTTVLRNLNGFLEENDFKFLNSDSLSYADCALLPKLQHIRLAGKEYKEYEISDEFLNVWKYLDTAYQENSFTATMPSDQDIVQHYEMVGGAPKGRGRPTLQKRTFTTTIPERIKEKIRALMNDQVNGDDAPNGNEDVVQQSNGNEDVVEQSRQLEEEEGQYENAPEEAPTYENVEQTAE